MDITLIQVLISEYWFVVTALSGALLLLGGIYNWNWLCDPVGKPHNLSRSTRRWLFAGLGLVLIGVSILHVLS